MQKLKIVNAKDNDGKTPLDLAKERNYTDIINPLRGPKDIG
ncbi:hypothetical protein [Bacteroidetes bacterium endosymbiont of Geopemphigus sp.]|nr:hypothetical protein [Bacteroidetes bacterium endosymbiont of Geopemphigus sp.]